MYIYFIEVGENCIMRSFITCTFRQVYLNDEVEDGMGMHVARMWRKGMHIGYSWESQKERYH
jgi:hypothetical protein